MPYHLPSFFSDYEQSGIYKLIMKPSFVIKFVCVCLWMHVLGQTVQEAVLNPDAWDFIIAVDRVFCINSLNDTGLLLPLQNSSSNSSSIYTFDRLPLLPATNSPFTCCRQCSLHPNCSMLDNCCPEMAKVANVANITSRCIPPQLRPYDDGKYPNAGGAIMQVSCSNSTDISNVLKCLHAELYHSLDALAPMTDPKTNMTYRNKFCAMCNGVTEESLIRWKPEVACSNNSFFMINTNTLVNDIHHTESCNLIFRAPEHLYYSVLECPPFISSCNMTGMWNNFDPLIQAACLAYTHEYRGQYKNIFCYLCNIDIPVNQRTVENCTDFDNSFYLSCVITSFSAILRVDVKTPISSLTTAMQCRPDQIYDAMEDVCRWVTCYPPRHYTSGECVDPVASIGGVSYQVYLKLLPLETVDASDDLQLSLSLEIYFTSLLRNLSHEWTSLNGSVFLNTTPAHADNRISVKEPLGIIVRLYISIPAYFPVNTSFIEDMVALDNETLNIPFLDGHVEHFTAFLIRPNDTQNGQLSAYDIYQLQTFEKIISFHRIGMFSENVSYTEVIVPMMLYPLVAIPHEEFSVEVHDWGVFIRELDCNLTREEYIRMPSQVEANKTVYITKSKFETALGIMLQKQLHHIENTTSPSDLVHKLKPQAYISLVCTCFSVFCSVLTLVTYAIFRELRTQPGVNNMMLTGSLMCAQILFQFGSDQAAAVPNWACQLLGILVHFSWLMTAAWMSICSFHMFQVFRSLNQVPRNDNIGKTTLVYIIMCFKIAAIPVITNVVVSRLADSKEYDIGYGGKMCYISRDDMVGYVFAIPIGILITANVCFFVATVICIKRFKGLEENKSKHRNYLSIYIRLSCLSGATWVFGFVFYFTGFVVIEYCFIILNCCQGVFIFVSFVCNKRVFVLYNGLINPSRAHTYIHKRASKTASSTC